MASSRRDSGRDRTYWDKSKRPLEILALVAPLVVLYEIGLISSQRSARGVLTNAAHEWLFRFFWSFGIDAEKLALPALALPAVAVVVVLLIWQVLSRKPWTVHLPTVGLMAAESALFALPLLVIAEVVARAALPALGAQSPDVAALTGFSRVTMSIGAGIYEELVFRMVLLALLHGVLVDLFRMGDRWGTGIALAASAFLFAIYHPVQLPSGKYDWPRLVFFMIAGLYFGGLYLIRGFGIAVGAHAAYDLAVLAWLADP